MAKEKHKIIAGLEDALAYAKGDTARGRKVTMRTYAPKVEPAPLMVVDAKFIKETRAALNVSQAVFAAFLKTSCRTVQGWEQGRTVPNQQASVLIHLARRYPDTLKRISSLG